MFYLVWRAFEMEVPGSTQDAIFPFILYSRKPVYDILIYTTWALRTYSYTDVP
jgi:hypothetical protein